VRPSLSGRAWSELLSVVSLCLFPWSVLSYGSLTDGSTTLLFAWGLFDPGTGQLTGLHTFLAYTRGLPDWLLAWPVGVAVLVSALASVTVGHARRRDDDPYTESDSFDLQAGTEHVTAALLGLVGLAVLSLSWGFSVQPGRTGTPIGTLFAWALAGRFWLRHRRSQ
jgi:uncharacterized protein (TIGR04206 family)